MQACLARRPNTRVSAARPRRRLHPRLLHPRAARRRGARGCL